MRMDYANVSSLPAMFFEWAEGRGERSFLWAKRDGGAEFGARQRRKPALVFGAESLGVGGERRQVALEFGAVAAGVEVRQVPFGQRSEIGNSSAGFSLVHAKHRSLEIAQFR